MEAAGWTAEIPNPYREPPHHPLPVEPIGTESWPLTFRPPEGLEVPHTWSLYALPSPGPSRLVWIRVEVPVRDGWVVWPAPMIAGTYVYGGFDRAIVVREGLPPSEPTWIPLPPTGDSEDLVPTIRDAPALIVTSTRYHRYILLLHVSTRHGPYRFGPDTGATIAALLGTLALWTLDHDPVHAIPAFEVLLRYVFPTITTGWLTYALATALACAATLA